MTYGPFFMGISGRKNWGFLEVIKLCLHWRIGHIKMRIHDVVSTSPYITDSSQSV